jgi:Na+-driven multidrug efflux pump
MTVRIPRYHLEINDVLTACVDVAKMVTSILPFVALFQMFDGNVGITGGILRARGKQGTGALLNLRLIPHFQVHSSPLISFP